MRCPYCGRRNRIRLMAGKRVRIRCGFCGEVLPVDKRRIVMRALGQYARTFFSERLPLLLIAGVDAVAQVAGALFRPVSLLWKSLIPPELRKRLAWGGIALLVVAYMILEGALKLTSMLFLVVVLALVMVAVYIAARGPVAFMHLVRQASRKFIRWCPYCGHRYFGWLKSCPRCGR